MKQRYLKRKELIILLDLKIKDLQSRLEKVNGNNYPKKCDSKGWELYGKISALAWVKIMYLDNKSLEKGIKDIILG